MPQQTTFTCEQSAISHAQLMVKKALAAIPINYTPCVCRRFMMNFEQRSGSAFIFRTQVRVRDYPPDRLAGRRSELKGTADGEQDTRWPLTVIALSQATITAANRFAHALWEVALNQQGDVMCPAAAETPRQGVMMPRSSRTAVLAEKANAPLTVGYRLRNANTRLSGTRPRASLIAGADAATTPCQLCQPSLVSAARQVARRFLPKPA